MFLSGVAYCNLAMTERDANIQDTRKPHEGFAAVAKPSTSGVFPLFQAPFHDPISQASVRVREDGMDLSLPRSNLADIVALGGGRWTAWNGEIYYSASRNSENQFKSGRFYSASYRPILISQFSNIYIVALLFFVLAWLRPASRAVTVIARTYPRSTYIGAAVASLALAGFIFSWDDGTLSHRAGGDQRDAPNSSNPFKRDYFSVSKPSIRDSHDYRLQRREGESELAFAQRISQLVFESNAICPPSYGGSLLLAVHDFANKREPILRGQKRLSLTGELDCGQCGQYAAFTASILRAGGLNARPVGLFGHIVVEVRSPAGVFFFDPTVGIGPLQYDGDSRSLTDRALLEYSALPEYQRLGVYYKNVDQRIEYLTAEVIADRIAFEEQLDDVQGIMIAALIALSAILFVSGFLYRIGSRTSHRERE